MIETHQKDCLEVLKSGIVLPDSVDLIMTSPPYAEQRKTTYGGIPTGEYVDWFMERSEEFYRVISPTGSMVINIKEHSRKGEKDPYVIRLILALRDQGWRWVEEYIWHKPNAFPGKWPDRFRNAWERCLHFTKGYPFKMNQEAVAVPTKATSIERYNRQSDNDELREHSKTGSGFSKVRAGFMNRKMSLPTNVVTFPPVHWNKGHSAPYPPELPEWFITLFTDPGDLVLDPFAGSGTTVLAAYQMGRHAVGIEIDEASYLTMTENVDNTPLRMQL